MKRHEMFASTIDFERYRGRSGVEDITWSPVADFKGSENDVALVVGVTDIQADWRRGVAKTCAYAYRSCLSSGSR